MCRDEGRGKDARRRQEAKGKRQMAKGKREDGFAGFWNVWLMVFVWCGTDGL